MLSLGHIPIDEEVRRGQHLRPCSPEERSLPLQPSLVGLGGQLRAHFSELHDVLHDVDFFQVLLSALRQDPLSLCQSEAPAEAYPWQVVVKKLAK